MVTYVPSDMPLEERPHITSKSDMKEMHPECFDQSEGKPRYFTITLEQNSTRVIHGPCRVPFERNEKLKKKLDKMDAEDVIKKSYRAEGLGQLISD